MAAVGIVIVSHSATLASGVAEVAREMGGTEVRLELAGGLDEPGSPLGTDAVRVAEAIEQADSGDGVLVLMDLGSAVLSAEMALDLLPPERREHVLLCEAPLVEGAVAAAVAARLGSSLPEVAEEARGGLQGKEAQLGAGQPPASSREAGAAVAVAAGEEETVRLRVENPLGLHARPATPGPSGRRSRKRSTECGRRLPPPEPRSPAGQASTARRSSTLTCSSSTTTRCLSRPAGRSSRRAATPPRRGMRRRRGVRPRIGDPP